jgi:hypothetical protein
MSGLSSIGPRLRIVLTSAILCACGGDSEACLAVPCALPVALRIALTSASSGTPVHAVIAVSGNISGSLTCAGACSVLGTAGSYTLDITAPGFQNVKRTVSVEGTAPTPCGCGSANAVQVNVALVATP